MTAKMSSRLEQLEEIAQQHRTRMANAVMQATLASLGDADLKALKQFFNRLVCGSTLAEALGNRTREETTAIDLFNAGSEAAALRIKGRP